jgi:hypothetical protein
MDEEPTFSTACGNAFRGVGSGFFRFRTLDRGCGLVKFGLNDVTGVGTNLGGEAEGTAAASAAALARPCRASMGALRAERGRVSSSSSSELGAVEGMIPYVAYL